MRLQQYQPLWNRIDQFQFDDPNAAIKFSDKLASQNNWEKEFTLRAIEEYKKFIFLCSISPSGASPSQIVDEVWHLHLTYTHNYWKEFCAKTLEKEIHHYPSSGGDSENSRHKNWYAETYRIYQEIFREHPPRDIWPKPQSLVSAQHFHELPEPSYLSAYKTYLYFLLLPFLIPFFFGRFHPFALTGSQFLFFFGALILATIIFFVASRKEKLSIIRKSVDVTSTAHASIYAFARFIFGKNKVLETAVVDLVSKRILVAERKGKMSFYPAKVDADTLTNNPLASNLLQHHKGESLLAMKDIAFYYNDDLTYHPDIAEMYRTVVKKDFLPYVVSLIIVAIGFIRIKQGLNNHYPVTYLQLMTIFSAFIFLVLSTNLSSKGLLRTVFISKYQNNSLTYTRAEPILSKFVFLGFSSIAGIYAFANLQDTFKNYRSDSSDVTTSCGSSGCGSSCGGGCGGCGGGD